ncbi:hypothetical protein KPATCC21470_3629 [Kitasatospora purpeofusca]
MRNSGSAVGTATDPTGGAAPAAAGAVAVIDRAGPEESRGGD